MKPSDYFHRNFGVTFEDDEAGVMTRHLIGVDNLLWGNDYPHHRCHLAAPRWRRSTRSWTASPTTSARRMCFTNTVKLYGIDLSALPA